MFRDKSSAGAITAVLLLQRATDHCTITEEKQNALWQPPDIEITSVPDSLLGHTTTLTNIFKSEKLLPIRLLCASLSAIVAECEWITQQQVIYGATHPLAR
jgi:hypothetical protein